MRNAQLNIILILLLATLCFHQVMAQDGGFRDVDFQVSLKNKSNGKTEYEPVQYCVVKSVRKAHDIRIALEKAISQQNEDFSDNNIVDKAMKKLNVVFQVSANNGTFRAHMEDGMAVVILAQSTYVKVEEIRPNQSKYDVRIERRALSEVTVTDRRRRGPEFKKVPGFDSGYEVRFTFPIYLPAGYTRDNSRMFVQPMVIDCQTEDTIAYAKPVIFEGRQYHTRQVQRMAFDYEKNDPLAPYYDSSVELRSNEEFDYTYSTTYRKPDKEKTYRGAYRVVLEDYHHVFYDNGGLGTGSCLAFRPFKFLNVGVATSAMDLNEDFREEATANYMAVDRKLTLTFETGKDVLTRDSLNDEQFGQLLKELKSYGDRLYKVQIEGAASAEGNEASNRALASKRAVRALSIIKNGLGSGADVRLPDPVLKV